MAGRMAWREPFITALRQGGNVLAACRAAGISRKTAYQTRGSSTAFAALWAEALEDSTDALHAVARQRAIAGSDVLLIYLLKVHGGPEWRQDQNRRVDVVADLEATVRKMAAEAGLNEAETLAAVAEAQRIVTR